MPLVPLPWSSIPLVDAAIGVAGAFWFAGPLLLACLKGCKVAGNCPFCYADFAMALLTGGMLAPILSPWIAPHLGFVGMNSATPVTLGVGFFCTPLRPLIQKAGEGMFTWWVNHFGKTGS